MSSTRPLSVAVPWSLSHYIPLNGFHPLYRALFDHAPSTVEFHAWDNVKLHKHFQIDIESRFNVLRAANKEGCELKELGSQSIAKMYGEYFWPPNLALTDALAGDIEFHHTAPYPSLKRPFVFHCESFAPIFLPFTQQGSGEFKNHQKLREHYHRIFANPLCLGIFSHIPETLDSLSRFFSDPVVDHKLFSSRIGLSSHIMLGAEFAEKSSLSRPTFLFVNSAHQNPANFFRRGGHIVLRFWKEFRASGRDGLLMVRCIKPSDEDLLAYGVDVSFLMAEAGHSIIWAEDYLSNYEMNTLVASAHFFLLPSLSLHSVSIMQAMTLGAIPVVTDTVGTSVYVTNDELGIVLRGVRSAIWQTDPNTGILIDRYSKIPDLDDSLTSQMTSRIFALLDAPDAYLKMRKRITAHAQQQFSGQAFSSDFWNAVSERYKNYTLSSSMSDTVQSKAAHSLSECTLQGDSCWTRVFESPTQPMRIICTGQSSVWEMGGVIIHAYGNPAMAKLSEWSVLARYYGSSSSPHTTFANTLDDLGGKHLSTPKTRAPDIELMFHQVSGYNIIRYVDEYYAIPQDEGEFILEKVKAGGYSSSFSGSTVYEVLHKIAISVPQPIQPISDNTATVSPELVATGIHGFSVFRYVGEYYAIPQDEGEFIPDKVKAGGYSSSFSGSTVYEVLHKIARSVPLSQISDDAATMHPELVLEGFHGFNIVRVGDEFHGILQIEGEFLQEKLLSKKYSCSFSGYSLLEIQNAIMASIVPDQDRSGPTNPLQPISDNTDTVHPELVLEGFHGFNIVRFGDEFHGILQIEGEFLQEKLLSQEYSCSFSGYSLLEIQNAIMANIAADQDRSGPTNPLQPISDNTDTVHPELVLEGFHGFNIVRFGDEFHGILQIEGEFLQEKLLSQEYSCSFSGYSLLEIQNAIMANIAADQDRSRRTKNSTTVQ